MDLSNLQNLKQQLVHGKDLSTIFAYFIENFGTDLAFMEMGDDTRDEDMEALIAGVGQRFFGTNLIKIDLKVCEIAATSFIHGLCWINGRQTNVIYFRDIHLGMVVFLPTSPGERVQYARFSGRQQPPAATPSEN